MNYQNTGLSVFLIFALSGTLLAMQPKLKKNQPNKSVDFFLRSQQRNVIEQPLLQNNQKKNQKIDGQKNVQQKPVLQGLEVQKQVVQKVKKNQRPFAAKRQQNQPAFDKKTSDDKLWNKQQSILQVQNQQIIQPIQIQNQVTNVVVEKPVKVSQEAKTIVQQEQKVQPQVSKNNAKENSGQKSVLSMSNGQKKLWQVFKKNTQVLNAKGQQNKLAFDKRIPNKKVKSQPQQIRSVKKQQTIVQKKVKNVFKFVCSINDNDKPLGTYYRSQDGQLKSVSVELKSNDDLSMVKNHLSKLNYVDCPKMNIPGEFEHQFPKTIEKNFGHQACVVIDTKDVGKICDSKQKFDLCVTMPGVMNTIENKEGKPYIINNKLGVFELKVRKSLYESKGVCLHRFFNYKNGRIGAQGFGAKFRAKEQRKLTKDLPTDI